jgi:hypothetical protein
MIPSHPTKKELSPTYWRQRAKEVRDAARDVHPINRKILEEVAASYEEMADLMESRGRPKAWNQRAPENGGKIADVKACA